MDYLFLVSIVFLIFFFSIAYTQKNPIFSIFSAILSLGLVSQLELSFLSIILIFFSIYCVFITAIYFREFRG